MSGPLAYGLSSTKAIVSLRAQETIDATQWVQIAISKARMALKWPKITQNGSGDRPDEVAPEPHAEEIPPFPTRQLRTASQQSPTTTNRQPPPTVNRCQPPTTNHARWAQKRSKMEIFKIGPRPLGRVKQTFLGRFGPGLTRFEGF